MAFNIADFIAKVTPYVTQVEGVVALTKTIVADVKTALHGVQLPGGVETEIDSIAHKVEANAPSIVAAINANTASKPDAA